MKSELLAGAAEVEITPPVGTILQGALYPRPAEGVDDPLFVKALALQQGETTLAQLSFDLCIVDATLVQQCVAKVSEAAGISPETILCTATHTHRGPLIKNHFPGSVGDCLNHEWRDRLPKRAAGAVCAAFKKLAPVRPTLTRAYAHGVSHYRRLEFKDGRHINTWLLNKGEDELQCVGAAGPIDPELLALAFEDDAGQVVAMCVSFALHACSGGGHGNHISADYPGVLSRSLRTYFGEALITLFLPAAGGNINPVLSRDEAGAVLAARIHSSWEKRRPIDLAKRGLGVHRSTLRLALRDLRADQAEKLRASQWPHEHWAYFLESQRELVEQGYAAPEAPLATWCLGDVALVTVPGELFVEFGMELKRRSPFAWTLPVTYTQDSLGYLITQAAWQAGGYEALVARQGKIAPEACRALVDELVRMLDAASGR